MWHIAIFIILFFTTAQLSFAAYSIQVTGFENDNKFTWHNDFKAPCSGDSSYVYTYPENDQYAVLHVCEDGYGIASKTIPDGKYYIMIAIGGYPFTSQVFEIKNGQLLTSLPNATPTPTPRNSAPTAIAGTSVDSYNNLQLDARQSVDVDNNELTYSWYIKQNLTHLSGREVSLSGFTPGTYTAILTVSDGQEQSSDEILFGITSTKQTPTISSEVKSFTVDKKDGSFTVKGSFDKKSNMLQRILDKPLAKISIEVQTGGSATYPEYSFVSEALQTASVKH